MKVLHISWLKRSDGELGGVEKFAHYLNLALKDAGHSCRIISWNDYPNAERMASIPNPDKALMLGAWAEAEIKFDVAVSDGYWGSGITERPVVPVIHGTWAQFHLNMGGSPWTNIEVRAQHAAFNAPNSWPVACSPAAAKELEDHHHRRPATVILHGIDLEEFYPLKQGNFDPPPVVLHAASNTKKGSAIIPAIARQLRPDFNVFYLDAGAGQEAQAFQRGDIFLHPSKHEGNAYALLEALATGLPIITTPVGLFASIEDGLVGRVLPLSATVSQWAAAVRDVWGDGTTPYRQYARAARQMAYKTASLQRFSEAWVHFLTNPGLLA